MYTLRIVAVWTGLVLCAVAVGVAAYALASNSVTPRFTVPAYTAIVGAAVSMWYLDVLRCHVKEKQAQTTHTWYFHESAPLIAELSPKGAVIQSWALEDMSDTRLRLAELKRDLR